MRRLTAGFAALVLAGCSTATPTGTPTPLATPAVIETVAPSASPPASVAPSASVPPTASPEPTHGVGTLDILPPGAAVQVTVDELNLRTRPSTSAKRVKLLKRGDVVVISPTDNFSFGYGPVRKNGYSWYPVVVTPYKDGALPPLPTEIIDLGGVEPTWGWVAADNGTRPYLATVAPRCPSTEDLATVQAMLPAERLACFGGPIVLQGTYGCGGCGGATAGTFKPNWIASPLSFGFLSVNPAERLGPIAVRFPPSGPTEPAAGTVIQVTVHVDDSRARRCTMAELDDSGAKVPVDSRTAVLRCREELVVDSFEVLGTDPSSRRVDAASALDGTLLGTLQVLAGLHGGRRTRGCAGHRGVLPTRRRGRRGAVVARRVLTGSEVIEGAQRDRLAGARLSLLHALHR